MCVCMGGRDENKKCLCVCVWGERTRNVCVCVGGRDENKKCVCVCGG